ncbi:MAG: dTDP-glucose 4,6-dehydratase [Candidatus Peribacteraceae bacterium]|nr:dTDP-glucose 4,6-dehydratase [Candidatus Peribacteraceae bacterium]
MNILVTGGAGFIGSHFVLRHCAQFPKDRLVVLDKLTYAADRHFLDPVKDQITFIEGDIADQTIVFNLLKEKKIDTVVDFAAETHVDNSICDPGPFLQTNVLGVQNLINACRAYPQIRFLHVSTDEVYGDVGDGGQPRTVEDSLIPSSPYAASKAAGDLLIIAAMRTYGIHAAITRCTNNYGPHQAAEKFIPTIIRAALADKPIPVYGNGRNKRDWLFVTDHCDAVEKILSTDWAFADATIHSGHLFNISADDERENLAVVRAILEILGKPENLISFVSDRPGHDWRYALDSSPTRALGWAPKVPFEKGLEETVQWYCSHARSSSST